jgi:hypothetical protein
VGVGVLIMGAYHGQQVIAASGAVASTLFYPAMRLARRVREQNMAIRLLEIPLTLDQLQDGGGSGEDPSRILRLDDPG